MEPIYREISRKVASCRHQKHITRCKERQTLFSIINDAKRLKIQSDLLSGLQADAVGQLIACWQERNNTDRTIYIKLALLKKYDFIKINPALLEQYRRASQSISKQTAVFDCLIKPDDIADPLVRWVAKTQILFGLKYREVVILHPGMLLKNGLYLPRAHTFNHRDRCIPISRVEQAHWVNEFKIHRQYQLQALAYHTVIKRIKVRYQSMGLPHLDYFRYHYAKWRHTVLLSQPTQSKYIRITVLREELGLSKNAQIRSMLTCLKKC